MVRRSSKEFLISGGRDGRRKTSLPSISNRIASLSCPLATELV